MCVYERMRKRERERERESGRESKSEGERERERERERLCIDVEALHRLPISLTQINISGPQRRPLCPGRTDSRDNEPTG